MEVGSSDSPETVTDNQSRHDSLPSPLYPPMITQSPISHIPTKLFIPKNYHVPYGPFTPEQAHCSDSKRPLHPDECSPDIHAAQGRKGLSPSDRFLSQPTHLEHSVYPLLEWKPDQKEQHRLVRHFVQHIATWVCTPASDASHQQPADLDGELSLICAIQITPSRQLYPNEPAVVPF